MHGSGSFDVRYSFKKPSFCQSAFSSSDARLKEHKCTVVFICELDVQQTAAYLATMIYLVFSWDRAC